MYPKSNRLQKKSECCKNISVSISCTSFATFFFLPHFDNISDLLFNRCTSKWNLFAKCIINFVLHATYTILENTSFFFVISSF